MKVKGYRVLVKPDSLETETKGGIILVLNERLEAAAQQFGTVVGIGETCWTGSKGEKLNQWCEIGDRILFSKHAGRFVFDPEDNNEEYMVINDTDVICVLEEKE